MKTCVWGVLGGAGLALALLRHHRQLVQAWRVEVLVGCVGWHRKHWGGICLAMAFIILARCCP